VLFIFIELLPVVSATGPLKIEAIAAIKATRSTGYLLYNNWKQVPENGTYSPPRQPVQILTVPL
jgi:hypothetical protein